jgi:hypothetical protein
MITTDNRLPNMGDIAPNTECSVSARLRSRQRTLPVTVGSGGVYAQAWILATLEAYHVM